MEQHIFIGISVSPNVKKHLETASKHLRNDWPLKKWVHPEDYHLTLTFIGPSKEKQRNLLFEGLEKIAVHHQIFSLTLSGFDCFGTFQHPRVLFAGVEQEPKLFQLQRAVSQACNEAGFKIDQRPYSPHITLAKRYNDQAQKPSIPLEESWKITGHPYSWNIASFEVFAIDPKHAPSYSIIRSFPFQP